MPLLTELVTVFEVTTFARGLPDWPLSLSQMPQPFPWQVFPLMVLSCAPSSSSLPLVRQFRTALPTTALWWQSPVLFHNKMPLWYTPVTTLPTTAQCEVPCSSMPSDGYCRVGDVEKEWLFSIRIPIAPGN